MSINKNNSRNIAPVSLVLLNKKMRTVLFNPVIIREQRKIVKAIRNNIRNSKINRVISSNGSILAIRYNVWISGTKLELEKKQCINTLSIKETVEGADSATLEIQDPEFKFIEDNIFIEENQIKIMLGWDSTTYRVVFEGYISAVDINFNNDGIPKLTVTCMDNTHKMNRKKVDKTFKDTTSAAVVKSIVSSYGFSCEVDNSYNFEKQETITQSHQTDIEFITKLAGDEVSPFTARLVGNTFHYEKMGKLQTPVMSLMYRAYPHDIISFTPKINKESKQVEIKDSSIKTSNKKVSSTTGIASGTGGSATPKGNNSKGSSSSNKSSRSNSNSSSKNKKSSGSYTYNPETKSWTH